MNSASEEFRQRESLKPDQYTMAWWKEQFAEVVKAYRGATHAINRSIAEVTDLSADAHQSKAEAARQRIEIEAIRAKIGETRELIEVLTERVDRMAEFLTKLKNGGNGKA